jgi:hypothetical protein
VKSKRSVLGVLAAAALASTTLVALAPAASGDPSANVTICHRTNSNTNPYVQITVDESAVDGLGGGSDHLGAHTGPVWDPTLKADHIKWGDIIPPFDTNNVQRPDPTLIANWPAGEAIFENGCKPVTPPEPELVNLSVSKTVSGTVPEGVTGFTAEVTCDEDAPIEVTLPVGGGVGTPASIPVEVGSQCSVVETEDGGADSVSYSVAGIDTPPGVFVDTDTNVEITNTFDPAPVTPVTPTEVSPADVVVTPAPVVSPAVAVVSPATFTG